jgi:hypothetical protein
MLFLNISLNLIKKDVKMNKKIISLSIIIVGVVCATTYFLKEDKIELKEIVQQPIQKLQPTKHNMRVVKRPEIKSLTQEEIEENKKEMEKMEIISKYGKQYVGLHTLEELDIMEKEKTEINIDNFKDMEYLYSEEGKKVFKIYKEINEKDVSYPISNIVDGVVDVITSYKPIYINTSELIHLSSFKDVSFKLPILDTADFFKFENCVKEIKKRKSGVITLECDNHDIFINKRTKSLSLYYKYNQKIYNISITNDTGYITLIKRGETLHD